MGTSLNIGIILDHPKRDLAGVVMIAYALAARGHSTSIIPLYDQAVDVPLLGLDAIIVNYARPANIDLVQGYVDMGLPVFVLDTEGGILAEDGANAPDQLADFIRQSGYADLLSGYLFWGPRLHEAFVVGSGMPAERLHVTGCPRFDYASPRWEATLIFSRSGYILVNANFPLVNPLFVRTPEEELATLIKAGWEAGYVEQLLIDLRQILLGYLRTISDLATRFPHFNFLVRPHPFENSQLYQDRFANFPNVIVDGMGSVLNVIRHSQCVLHLNCGTSVEATMLHRLPISLEFLNTNHMANHSTLPSRISWRADSFNAVCGVLERLSDTTKSFKFAENYRENISPWFYINDGNAAERVVEMISRTVVPRIGKRRTSVARSLASSRRNSSNSQRLQSAFANLVGSQIASEMRALVKPARQEKRLLPEAVISQLALISSHAKTKQPAVSRACHPWTNAPLASLLVTPV